MIKALQRHGPRSRPYLKAQEEISRELMMIRFGAKQIESLCDSVRRQVEEVRSYERAIMELCVEKAGMPRAHFIKLFPGNEEDLDWVRREVQSHASRTATRWAGSRPRSSSTSSG